MIDMVCKPLSCPDAEVINGSCCPKERAVNGKCCPSKAVDGKCKEFECPTNVMKADGKTCCPIELVWDGQCCPEPLQNWICHSLDYKQLGLDP